MKKIVEFKISKLYGYRNIELKINNNILILVGENGSGKTTILRIMYLFLSGRWIELLKYDFLKISVLFEDKSEIFVERNQLLFLFHNKARVSSQYTGTSLQDYYKYISLLEKKNESSAYIRHYFDDNRYTLLSKKDINDLFFFEHCKELEEFQKKMENTTVLYLPTYRRIEKELSAIFDGIDEDELRRKDILEKSERDRLHSYESHEIVKFGMRDIKASIKHASMELNKFVVEELNHLTLHYLSDVVEQKYKRANIAQIKNAKEESINNILKRINKDILSQTSHSRLSATIKDIRAKVKDEEQLNDHEKVICHYFTKLLDFQKQLDQKEERIKRFCNVCNTYLIDKQFYYDSSSFSAYIHHNNEKAFKGDNSFDLEYLSSGEKQIVSLFGTLYLAKNDDFLILIDEPELSLSVSWQQKFLVDVRDAICCTGLIAATHSPFIFENKLDPYVHGLNEFITE